MRDWVMAALPTGLAVSISSQAGVRHQRAGRDRRLVYGGDDGGGEQLGDAGVAPVVHVQAVLDDEVVERDVFDRPPVAHDGVAAEHRDVLAVAMVGIVSAYGAWLVREVVDQRKPK
jgi:hypothetical protein